MIKAIIFDMDGVLVDAKDWHFHALNEALELFGYRISQFENYQRFDGLPTREKLKMLASERGFPRALAGFVNEMKQQYLLETAAELCVPNPIHVATLQRLRDDGFALAVASNSIRRSVDELLDKTSLSQFLSLTLSNEDVDRPKPSPEIYQLAICRLRLQPEECLVVEDGDYGVEAATAAGAHVLRVRDVHEVHYENIQSRIVGLEQGSVSPASPERKRAA